MAAQVLIIDDDTSFQHILQMRLKSILSEPTFTCCNNLSSAREFLQNNSTTFDLVVLDQHLPDGAGNDLLNEGWFEGQGVLAVSSDEAPEMPGASVMAGAAYFINKVAINDPMLVSLVRGIMDRNGIQRELAQAKEEAIKLDTVKTLVKTLRHEINNPLGAVLGAAYIMRTADQVSDEQKEAAQLVESSGQRIKHVLDQLCDTVALEPVSKASEKVFHIPGDEPWDEGNES